MAEREGGVPIGDPPGPWGTNSRQKLTFLRELKAESCPEILSSKTVLTPQHEQPLAAEKCCVYGQLQAALCKAFVDAMQIDIVLRGEQAWGEHGFHYTKGQAAWARCGASGTDGVDATNRVKGLKNRRTTFRISDLDKVTVSGAQQPLDGANGEYSRQSDDSYKNESGDAIIYLDNKICYKVWKLSIDGQEGGNYNFSNSAWPNKKLTSKPMTWESRDGKQTCSVMKADTH